MAQVPKQGRNLRRESAFYAALVAQVPVLKWNLHHLRRHLHRSPLEPAPPTPIYAGTCATRVLQRNTSRADGVTIAAEWRSTCNKKAFRQLHVAPNYRLINKLAQLTGMRNAPVSCANYLSFNDLSATAHEM